MIPQSLGLHEFSDNSVSQDGVLSPAGAVVDRKRRRLDMDGVKSPGNRSGRKISEYFKVDWLLRCLSTWCWTYVIRFYTWLFVLKSLFVASTSYQERMQRRPIKSNHLISSIMLYLINLTEIFVDLKQLAGKNVAN